ncbi:MAG: YggS family pyridoxal phosphate-dependent enzyme [Gammaproteobacteria bacterium]
MNQITVNLDYVKRTIADTASTYGRTAADIKLLAVSKRHSIDAIKSAQAAGQTSFGENFVAEGVEKTARLPENLDWHFIGQIQSNKTRLIARHFSWVHTVDRLRIARRLSDQREQDTPLNILIQVHLGGGEHRAGVAPAATLELAHAIHDLPNVALRGLMVLPPAETEFDAQRGHFARVAALAKAGRDDGLPLHELSMGMSGDLAAAICEGATWVRVGTAIFGPRPGT